MCTHIPHFLPPGTLECQDKVSGAVNPDYLETEWVTHL